MLGAFTLVSATLARASKSQVKGEVTVSTGAATAIEIVEPQPVKMDELAILDVGERSHNWRKTWTQTPVIVEDIITRSGKSYKVHQVENRSVDGNFYRVLMRELTSYRA